MCSLSNFGSFLVVMLSCLLGAACAEAPAVRSRWNLHTRSNGPLCGRFVQTTRGPTLPQIPSGTRSGHEPRSWTPRPDLSRPTAACRRPTAMRPRPQMYGSSVRIDRETCPEHPHSVASTVGAPSCCGCWTRDWRAPSLPQVGTITVLNCVMAGAPASASRTPL